MSEIVEIRGDLGASVRLEVYGFDDPSAFNLSDANWLSVGVYLAVEGASVEYNNCHVTTQDLRDFAGDVRRCLSALDGDAKLITDEDEIRISLSFSKTGRVRVDGVAQRLSRNRARVEFSFESDQSFLATTLSELEVAVAKNPVRTESTRQGGAQ